MRLIKEEKMNKLVADEGKHIRDINDIYTPVGVDKEGNEIPEHIPYYTTTIYLPTFIDLEKITEMYVEEEME